MFGAASLLPTDTERSGAEHFSLQECQITCELDPALRNDGPFSFPPFWSTSKVRFFYD